MHSNTKRTIEDARREEKDSDERKIIIKIEVEGENNQRKIKTQKLNMRWWIKKNSESNSRNHKRNEQREEKAHRLHKKVFDSLNSFSSASKNSASGGMGLRNPPSFLPELLRSDRDYLELVAQIFSFNYSVCHLSAIENITFSHDVPPLCFYLSFSPFPIYHLYTHDDADDTHSWRLSLPDNYMDEHSFIAIVSRLLLLAIFLASSSFSRRT